MDSNKQKIISLVPALRMILSGETAKTGSFVPLARLIETDPEKLSTRLNSPVPVFGGEAEEVIRQAEKQRAEFTAYCFVEGLGLLGLSENQSETEQKLEAVRRHGRGTGLSELSALPRIRKSLFSKIIAITGGGMGFGEGMARHLFAEGAHVVVLDINEKAGNAVATDLNNQRTFNRALFVKTDVSDAASVADALFETVLEFGGLDVMISNAGVLKAGSIDEMDPETFDFVTRVNYNGYFNCVKAAVPVMRLQNRFAPEKFGDIIQINSKSGLVGSKKNFAYAGSKFGGIGLTHSFAMDLMPDRIKVNSICPGNYFEGPLWSDPEKGLFVQYLKAGKVPGAQSVEDVRRHYESMVPAGRGCRPLDVVRAIKYVIEQEYETGQAIPVTGGQVMLS
ncbi:MAG: SDR family NAD(P)-dependent oxidoreductase [Bacteroidales bacterium]